MNQGMPSTQGGPPDVQPGLAEFIRSHEREILDEWTHLVRQIPAAAGLDHPALLDHVPDVLNRVADLADAIVAGEHAELPREIAERHAIDRLGEGFDLREVVQEYSLLRDCILRRWEENTATLDVMQGVSVFSRAIDRAVGATVERYTHARDRTLAGLDRVATVALESRNLSELLEKLLQVLVETTASVDTAAILLRRGDQLSIRAAVGLEEDLERGFTLRVGEGFAGTICAERSPKFVRAVSADALVKSEVIRKKGLRALFGVPLLEGDECIGVAHIGSYTAFDFSEQDKRLLSALAHRASAAIAQYLLREALEERARQLDASEARLQRILEHAPVPIYVKDEAGRIVMANSQLGAICGRPREELLGKRDEDLFPPEAAEHFRALDQQVRDRAESVVAEEVLPMGDGLHTYLSVKFPMPGEQGQQLVGGISTDITDRKHEERAQRFLKDVTALLGSSLEHRATLARVATLAVPALADLCVFELVDDGGGAERIVGDHPSPELAALARELPMEGDQPIVRQLGTRCLMVAPMFAHGRRLGAVAFLAIESSRGYSGRSLDVAVEVAARASLALENARLYHAAQESVRAREVVLAVVSHDLKNPLSAINIGTALLRGSVQDPRALKHIDTISRATKRMDHLITDLLDMASIQAGHFAIAKDVQEAEPLVNEAVEQNAPMATEKGLAIERCYDLRGVRVWCDRDRIFQVFANLLGNAVKFGRTDGTIRIETFVDGDRLRVTIADDGPGIGEAELRHIFEPYWSGAQHTKKGTGLGLFITKGIIEAHGGRLSATSTIGVGSTFTFTLPIAP